MSYFKVTDVRVKSDEQWTLTAVIDGLVATSEPVTLAPARAALLLDVFSTGRDCYWDNEAQQFTTLPLGAPDAAASQQSYGEVASWDITVAADGSSTFFVSLLGNTDRPTSGNPATGWAEWTVSADVAVGLLGLLNSPYCYYEDGTLRNSDLRF